MNPRPFAFDEQLCIYLLEDWATEFDDLLALIGPATFIGCREDDPGSCARAEEARTHLETLKQRLTAEADTLKQRDVVGVEATYYVRPVRQAAASLTLPSRETNGETWRQDLGYARAPITLALARLKHRR